MSCTRTTLCSCFHAVAGIREVWLVDLTTNAVEVCREPEARSYGVRERVTEGALSPLVFPELEIAVADILPV